MQTTVSFHLNPDSPSVAHNLRDPDSPIYGREPHIDYTNEHGNSYHKTIYHEDIKDFYAKMFGKPIEEYNARQKRKDRKITIDSYMQSIEDNRQGRKQTVLKQGKRIPKENAREGKQLFYEFTVKIGNTTKQRDADGRVVYDSDHHQVREQFLPTEIQQGVLKRYIDTFYSRHTVKGAGGMCPVGIYYHGDEGYYNKLGEWERGVDNLHITYVPIATGFKNGLPIQNSMNKALKALGLNDYDDWQKRENAYIEQITQEEYAKYCKDHPDFYRLHGDLEIIHPVHDRLEQGGLDKENYIAQEKLAEDMADLQNEKTAFRMKKKRIETALDEQKQTVQALQDDFMVKARQAEEAQQRALQKLSEAHSEKVQNARDREQLEADRKALDQTVTKKVNDRLRSISNRQAEAERKQQDFESRQRDRLRGLFGED